MFKKVTNWLNINFNLIIRLVVSIILLLLMVGVVLPWLYKLVIDYCGVFCGSIMFVGAFVLVGLFHLYDWWLDNHQDI